MYFHGFFHVKNIGKCRWFDLVYWTVFMSTFYGIVIISYKMQYAVTNFTIWEYRNINFTTLNKSGRDTWS